MMMIIINNTISGDLVILNSLGEAVLQHNKSIQKETIDLQSLSSGMYLVKIKNYTAKFIVK